MEGRTHGQGLIYRTSLAGRSKKNCNQTEGIQITKIRPNDPVTLYFYFAGKAYGYNLGSNMRNT